MKTHTFYASGENTTDFLPSKDEGHLHHAELANLAAMARSIFHQAGATEVAQPELTTLVSFNGTNGLEPWAGLIADVYGDLFGTTIYGGANDLGTAFEIAKTAHGYASSPTTLVSFNGANGYEPFGSLIADRHGDLFGTTYEFANLGTVFEIAKTAHGYASSPTTLVNFNGANGSNPSSGLIADAHGDLFGTTVGGGANGDYGTVFEIAKTASGYASTPTTLVSFNDANGAAPYGTLIADAHGNLFGTTAYGGPYGFGTVFEIAKTASGYASTPTTLVSFSGSANGGELLAGLIADAHGDLFGTTAAGGSDGDGTVFEIAKTAHGYASTPTTLVSFNGANGATPYGSLIADAHGDLFGTTIGGGAYGDGTVFEIAKTAHGYASTPTTLVSFNGTDGRAPVGQLIADAHGDLFGTTIGGGANGDGGTVFEITGSGFNAHPTAGRSVAESHDSFVFAPNLGENTIAKTNTTIQLIHLNRRSRILPH